MSSYDKTDDFSSGDDPFAIGETTEDLGLSSISYDSAMSSSADPYADSSSSAYASSSSFPTSSSLPPIRGGASKAPAEATGGIGGLFSRFGFGGKKEDDAAAGAAPVDSAAAAEARRSYQAPSLNVGLAAQASSLGLAARAKSMHQTSDREERYLRYERRGLFGQMSYNCGYSYIGGLALGGSIGFFQGLKNSPNRHPRVLINSILNGSGKNGSRMGNAAGVLAMLYTVLERQVEDAELDRLPAWVNNGLGFDLFSKSRSDSLIPASAAFATGALFTLPRAIAMRGLDKHYVSLPKRAAVVVSGGLLSVLGVATLALVGPHVFGRRSPFRFSS